MKKFFSTVLTLLMAISAYAGMGGGPQELYLVGQGDGIGWDAANPLVITQQDGKFVAEIQNLSMFKLSTAYGDWYMFDAEAIGCPNYGDTPGVTKYLEYTSENTLCPWQGDYTIEVSSNLSTIILRTDTPNPGIKLYLRGEMNDWDATSDWQLTPVANDIYSFTCAATQAIEAGQTFKIADAGWSKYNYGVWVAGDELWLDDMSTLVYGGQDITLDEDWDGVLYFRLSDARIFMSNNKETKNPFVSSPEDPVEAGVTLSTDFLELSIGETERIFATVYPETASQSVTWTSSNTDIAVVDADGYVTAVNNGLAFITATTASGKTATAKVKCGETYFLVGAFNTWTLADPDAIFHETAEPGVLRLELPELPSSFKVNNGTWDGLYDYGSDGYSITVGSSAILVEGGYNFKFRPGNIVVKNAVITLDLRYNTIQVDGQVTYRDVVFYFKNSYDGWEPDDSNRFQAIGNNKFRLENKLLTPDPNSNFGSFKISTDDWSIEYGMGAEITPYNLSAYLEEVPGGLPEMTGAFYSLAGYYDIEWDFANEFITFTPSVAPPENPEFLKLYVRGDMNDWEAEDEWELQTTDGNLYRLDGVLIPDGSTFKIGTDNWLVANYGAEYEDMALTLDTPTQLLNNENSFNLTVDYEGKTVESMDVVFTFADGVIELVKYPVDSPEPPAPEVCDEPLINIIDNRLVVTCKTSGSKIHMNVKAEDQGSYNGDEVLDILLSGCYKIEAYATCEGLEPSGKVYATLVWSNVEEVESDVEMIDMGTQRALLIRNVGENVEVVGTMAGEAVEVYTAAGSKLYSGKGHEGSTLIPVSMQQGEVYILTIGNRPVKYRF